MSVLDSAGKLKIPFTGFYYRQSDIQKHLFKPTAAILAVKVGDFEIEPHKSVKPKSLLQYLAVEYSSGACSDLF